MNSEYRKTKKFVDAEGVPNGIDICNTGSTFAQFGFDYANFDGKVGFNFALQPQSLRYDLKILEKFVNRIKPGAVVVVVVVCPFQFCVVDYKHDRYNFKYYHFLDKDSINGYSHWKNFLISKLGVYPDPLLIAAIVRNALRDITGSAPYGAEMVNKRLTSWKTEFGLSNTTTDMPSAELRRRFEITTRTLEDMLTLCKDKSFRPIIINMPAVKEESAAFSEAFMKAYYYDNIAKGNIVNAPMLDFFRDDRFHDPKLYENGADCFNGEGRKYFAEILIAELKKLDMWEQVSLTVNV